MAGGNGFRLTLSSLSKQTRTGKLTRDNWQAASRIITSCSLTTDCASRKLPDGASPLMLASRRRWKQPTQGIQKTQALKLPGSLRNKAQVESGDISIARIISQQPRRRPKQKKTSRMSKCPKVQSNVWLLGVLFMCPARFTAG